MAIKYIPFFPEPIEGQALLNNFKRTLRYKGANEVESSLRRGMPLYEMEKQETVAKTKTAILSSAASVSPPAHIFVKAVSR